MNIMMCSSARTSSYYAQFEKVVKAFGGYPQHYTVGNIYQIPGGTPNARKMSEIAVQGADMCVFVISDDVGSITWDTELPAAKDMGVPFVILAHQNAMNIFKVYESMDIEDVPVEHRDVVKVVRSVINTYGIEPRVFDNGSFEKELQEAILCLFAISLTEYRERHLRLRALLDDPNTAKRSPDLLRRIALDQFEDKRYRKAAIQRLCDVGISQKDALALLSEDEQGVSRLAANLLDKLVNTNDITVDFFERCIQIGNDQEDQGLIRRLVMTIYRADPVKAVEASKHINYREIGTRRRVGTCCLEHKDQIIAGGKKDDLLDVISICSASTKEEGWLKSCRDLRDRLLAANQME